MLAEGGKRTLIYCSHTVQCQNSQTPTHCAHSHSPCWSQCVLVLFCYCPCAGKVQYYLVMGFAQLWQHLLSKKLTCIMCTKKKMCYFVVYRQ